jgi:hypothetical protein
MTEHKTKSYSLDLVSIIKLKIMAKKLDSDDSKLLRRFIRENWNPEWNIDLQLVLDNPDSNNLGSLEKIIKAIAV